MPPRRWWQILGLIFLPAFFCLEGCGLKNRAPTDSNPIVLWVGTSSYTKADLERFFDGRLNEFRDSGATDEVKSALLDSFIEEKLLLSKAEELRIEPDAKALDSMRDRLSLNGGGSSSDLKRDKELERSMLDSLKAQQYLRDQLFKSLSVSPEECEIYYKEHIQDFVRNDVVHVREILVDSLDQAQKIQAQLRTNRNRNFKELARQYSKAPTAADGGELGMFQRGELPDEFEKAIFPLATGAISQVVRTQYGYHMFLLEEKVLAHQQKYAEVEDQIQEKLLLERQREALERELVALASQIKIQLDREKLDFNYVGTRLASRGGTS
jgi:parvulin-like peptidyl-prolyl isomerase